MTVLLDLACHQQTSARLSIGQIPQALRRGRVKVLKAPFRSPNTNAFVERFVYHTERPHQGRDNEVLVPRSRGRMPEPDAIPLSQLRCQSRLGGLLKHYYRKAV